MPKPLVLSTKVRVQAHITADYRIALPVTQGAAQFNLCRALADMTLTGQNPAWILTFVAFAAVLGHDSGVLTKAAAQLLVAAQPTVDGLCADAKVTKPFKRPHDLLRTEFLADHLSDFDHLQGTEVRPTAATPSPGGGIAVRLLGAILPTVGGQISLEFAANGASASA
jgi:hypothetical protein